MALRLNGKSSCLRIGGEHFHRVKRERAQVRACHFEGLAEDVVRDGDDVAATGVRLEDVEYLPHAGPKQLRLRLVVQQSAAGPHNRLRVDSRVRNAASED